MAPSSTPAPTTASEDRGARVTERRVVEQVHRLACIACAAASTAYLLWMLQRSPIFGFRVVPVVIVLAMFPLIGLSVYIARRRGRPDLALWMLAWPVFALLSVLMLAQGGAAGTAMWWLMLVPVATLHAGFLRSGLAMAALLAVQTVVWTLLPPSLPAWALIAPATDLQRAIAATGSSSAIALIVASNLHWRFRMRQQLVEARRTADAALDVKARFLAHMSHEIRTPLHGVSGAIDLLRGSRLDAGQQQALAILDHSNKVLTKWVETLLDHARLDGPASPTAGTPITASDPLFQPAEPQGVRRGPAEGTLQADDAGALTSRDASSTRPWQATHEQAPPAADAQRPRATPRNDPGTAPGADRSSAAVQDTAWLAMPPLPRAATSQRTTRPLELEPPAPSVAEPPETRPSAGMPQAAAARVLLVEDHPVNQLLARTMLEQIGCEVQVASDGQEAVERFEEAHDRRYDLVLMDCQMPVMDGFDASRAMRLIEARERRPRTPIVAMTANSEAEGAPATREAGMDDYITKPVAMTRLMQVVQSWTRPAPGRTPQA